eukprot:CAMPEP_0202702402 /NCGR_PEP_ID=MMETSP1385-20130828/15384_1 /ASSEMBLY_ACC=CAM_ASM_000861 /TAXON_ID=933848 /ORGANISM="Elphidium margaritaceum" /LENGTH=991 /DNA_ID=CAMNT_0049360043 /DNA_START=157 /DNA_END=3132 /DNA_ORIENTATION=-
MNSISNLFKKGGKQPKSGRDEDINFMQRGNSVMDEDSDPENEPYGDEKQPPPQYPSNQQHRANGARRNGNNRSPPSSASDNSPPTHQTSQASTASHSQGNGALPQQLDSNSSNGNNNAAYHSAHGGAYTHPTASRALTRSNDKLYVGDKILLANRRSGKVTSLGPKPDKEGIWVRVVMDPVHTNSDKMFDDKNPKNKTIWVPIQRVDKIISHGKKFDLTIDDRVFERKKRIAGTIKYVGPTHFDKGVWFGVALDSPKGKNNGTVKKKFYFFSEPNHGVMLPYKRLEKYYPEHDKNMMHNGGEGRKLGRDKRSKSQNFEDDKSKSKQTNGKERHFKTASDGMLGQHAQQLQLDQLQQIQNNNHAHSQQQIHDDDEPPQAMNGSTDIGDDMPPDYMDDDMPPDAMNGKTPSSDSDPEMNFSKPTTTMPTTADTQRETAKKAPTEKHPFVGWIKLVNGTAPLNPLDDDQKAHTEVVPYQLEKDEKTQQILERYTRKTKRFLNMELALYNSQLPPITDVAKEERERIFVQKLYLCEAKCDFFDESDQMIELIEKKERLLLELSEFIARHVWFKESLYEKCLETVSVNLFRALPYQDRPPALSFFNDEVFDKDTNFEDPAWRHLKLVYDLTWRVINTPQVTAPMMEKHMTGKFLGSLVELFASEDHRERAYLMMILHKIYGRCLKLRPYIIQVMSGYFYRMIYTDEFAHVNGIIELLQIICAIIPGLTVPVKESWQCFVRNILVPLHKCRGLKKFWEQLTQCCVNYVAKDEYGGAVILGGLLRFWPQQSPQKEEIFIMEVVNIINVLITHQHGFNYENYKEVLISAANKLTCCMLSTRQPVAERAIAAWKEQSMQRLVDYDRKAFLPKLCEAFYRNREHQNAALKQSSTAVEKIYRSKDSAYWRKMQQYLAKKDKKETAITKAIQEAQLKKKDPYDIVKAKHQKDVSKHKRPKPLTSAEKTAKREHYWKKMHQLAQQNKEDFDQEEESPEPPTLST